MNITLQTFNSHAINDGVNYNAPKIPGMMINLQSQAVYVDRPENFPYLSGAVLPAHSFTFRVTLPAGVTTISTLREQLKSWFSILDFTPHQLIGVDENSVQWYLTGYPVAVVKDPAVTADTAFMITLALLDPIWRSVVLGTDTWNIAAGTSTRTITAAGNTPTVPKLVITPTQARTGQYLYNRWIPIYSRVAKPMFNRPIDVTSGGFNTSALVGAGKMLASGNDLRMQVDGVQVNRWLDGINTATTKVWSNLNFSISQIGTLLGSLPNNSTAVTVPFKVTSANLAVLKALKAANNPVFLIGSEAFTYTQSNVDLTKYQITSCQRAQKQTSAAAHSDADSIIWIEHDIWMLYGNAAALPPDIDDTQKPLLNLNTSTNASWVFANFFDTTSARPAAWAGSILNSRGKQSYVYTGDESGSTTAPLPVVLADPATEMGLSMQAYQAAGIWKGETSTMIWSFSDPVGIVTVSVAGKKYQHGGKWPGVAGLRKSLKGTTWVAVWNETIGTVDTWVALTHNAVALSATYPYIRLQFSPSIAASVNGEADIQFDTVTLALDSTLTPVVALNSENGTYFINSTIMNVDTGDYIVISYPMQLNQAIAVDCLNKTVTYADGSNALGALVVSTTRKEWLTLSGATNMSFADTGTTGLTIATTWSDMTI